MPSNTVAVDLAARLYASDDLLGWKAPVIVDGVQLELRMPCGPHLADWEQVEDGDVPYLHSPGDGTPDPRYPPSVWGIAGTRLGGVEINAILISGLDGIPDDWDPDSLLRRLALWSGRFISWLNAGAGEIVAQRQMAGVGRSTNMLIAVEPKKQRLRTDFIASAVATATLARHAVGKVHSEVDVPVPWAIWDDAAHAVENDPRRAVIDACTAAEAAIESRLPRRPRLPGVVKKAEAHNQGSRSTKLPVKAIGGQLARPRNDAAHSGSEMTRQQSRQALEVARDVLRTIDPEGALVSGWRSA